MITSSKMHAAVECGRRKHRRAIGRKNYKITMKHDGNDELLITMNNERLRLGEKTLPCNWPEKSQNHNGNDELLRTMNTGD
ncbi:hypothetical protein P8452_30800 [Trifolium repens]|nr:hypothetical protein P8452_30800 [Trifolium repens]